MKRLSVFLYIVTMLIRSNLAASTQEESETWKPDFAEKRCHCGDRGPMGIQGPPSDSTNTAYGSFYFEPPGIVLGSVGNPLPFTETAYIQNMTHPNDTSFVILKSGFYYIYYGAYNNDSNSNTTALTINVNSVAAAGSRLNLPPDDKISSLGVIIPIFAGQTVTVENNVNNFSLGKAFITFVQLSPL